MKLELTCQCGTPITIHPTPLGNAIIPKHETPDGKPCEISGIQMQVHLNGSSTINRAIQDESDRERRIDERRIRDHRTHLLAVALLALPAIQAASGGFEPRETGGKRPRRRFPIPR